MEEIDTARVLCRASEVPEGGSRGFSVADGDWPLRGLIVRHHGALHAYVNRCPHAGHPLELIEHRFLSPDGLYIVCRSHGALFEKSTGFCVGGPCVGRSLEPVAIRELAGLVMLAG